MIRRLISLPVVAAMILGLSGCLPAADKAKPAQTEPLAFSILSAETQKSLGPLWQPVVDDLSKAIGRPVKPFFASNYTSLVEAMRFNQVQMGWFSALPALEATRRAQGEVVGRFVALDGRDSYQSVLIVRKGSGLTLDKVMQCNKRLTFGLGDAKSTSGTLAPMAYLFIPKGVEPSDCFKVVRSASHESNVWSVSKGVLDVATNNSVGLVFAKRENPAVAANIEVIWESPPLPESGIVVRSDLDPALKAKIAQFFLTYGKAPGAEGERQRAVLRGLESAGFKTADNSYLDPVRRMEASSNYVEAKRSGDAIKIAAAKKALDDLGPAPQAPAAAPAG